MKKQDSYIDEIMKGLKTALGGMKLTGRHYNKGQDRQAPLGIEHPDYFKKEQGPITIQYPMEKVPVPDNGRYRLHMETDDCIGCDKCARICPVDCITIETFRADGDLGQTSDGTTKRLHLPTFDIDMGKCMYCGLCTTVCPTECLTMTKVYDYSEYDRDNFVYHFGAYSPQEEVTIRKETELALAKKKAEKEALAATEGAGATPRRKPMARPVTKKENEEESSKPAPKFKPRPVMKKKAVTEEKPETKDDQEAESAEGKPKHRPRPVMKKKPVTEEEKPEDAGKDEPVEAATPRPRPRPIMKKKPTGEEKSTTEASLPKEEPAGEETKPKFKPRPRPIMKKKPPEDSGEKGDEA